MYKNAKLDNIWTVVENLGELSNQLINYILYLKVGVIEINEFKNQSCTS